MFAPFATKANDANTPDPASLPIVEDTGIPMTDKNPARDLLSPISLPIDTQQAKKISDSKYTVNIQWTQPKINTQTIVFQYSGISNTLLGTRAVYTFEKYQISRNGPDGNKTIATFSGDNNIQTNNYTDNIDLSNSSENAWYQYTVTAVWKIVKVIKGFWMPGEIKYTGSPRSIQLGKDVINTTNGSDIYSPNLAAKPDISKTDNAWVGTVDLQWLVGAIGDPPGWQNCAGYTIKQHKPGNAAWIDVTSQATSKECWQGGGKASIDAVKIDQPNTEMTYEFLVKAYYPDHMDWGYSNVQSVTFKTNDKNEATVTVNGSAAAPAAQEVGTSTGISGTEKSKSEFTCGCGGIDPIKKAVCDMLCSMTNALAKVASWSVETFMFASIKDDNSDKPKGLVNDFNPDQNQRPDNKDWIFTIWNFSLQLVNAFLIAILIFLAFVNILHIQIDTYALKKILPMLVLGVIFANFSMLICRAIIDFSDMLTVTFTGNLTDLISKVMNALGMGVLSLSKSIDGIVANIGLFGGIVSWASGFILTIISALLIIIIFGIVFIGAFVLGFLLWVRIPIVSILVAISPLAFMAMTFPITQKYFTQWWGLFLNWVFMLPVIMFLFKAVSLLNTQNTGFDIAAYFVALLVMFIAIMVPFKMGGAIMQSWSTFGKKLAGGAWKGYGTAWGKMVDKGGTIGKIAKWSNLYAANDFVKERLDVMEKNRLKMARKTPYYAAIAGQEAAFRFTLGDEVENVRALNSRDDLKKYIDAAKGDTGIDGDTIKEWASTPPRKVPELINAWNKAHPGQEKVTEEKAGQLILAYKQGQILERWGKRSDIASERSVELINSPRGVIPPRPDNDNNPPPAGIGKAGAVNQIDSQKAAKIYGQNHVEDFNPMQYAVQQDLEKSLEQNLTDPHLSAEIKPLVELHASPEYMIKNQNLFGETNDKIKKLLEPLAKNQLGKIELGNVSATVLEDVALRSKINIAKEINPYLENETAIKQAINSDRSKRQQNIQNIVNNLNLPNLKIDGPVQNITLKDRMNINEKLDVEINKSNAGEELKAKLKEAKRQVNIDFNGMHYGDTAEKTFDKIKNDFGSIKDNIAGKITGEK